MFVGDRKGRRSEEVTGIRSWRYPVRRRATERDFYNSPAEYTGVAAPAWSVVAHFTPDDPMLTRLRQATKAKSVLRITGGSDLISEMIDGQITKFRKLKGDRYRFTIEPVPQATPLDKPRPLKARPRKALTAPKTERNRKILRAYRGRPRPTFKTLARRFRISPSRVGQIIAKGKP